MKKTLVAIALLMPLFANAQSTAPDGDEILSLRYSDTSLGGIDDGLWGVSFSNVRGKGNFGFSISADMQKFEENGNYIEDVGQEKKMYEFSNIMLGATYGITDDLYIIPKIGFSYSKLDEHYEYKFTDSDGNPDSYLKSRVSDDYSMSYGIDFMFLYKSLAYGIGITDYNYFDTREAKANITVGYKF